MTKVRIEKKNGSKWSNYEIKILRQKSFYSKYGITVVKLIIIETLVLQHEKGSAQN